MIPFVGIVGYGNSGKTTLIEKLVGELVRRGYRVATIKHHHKELEFDRPGKDTWRHAQAGAETVVLVSPRKMVKIKKMPEEIELRPALEDISGVDIILVEGFKKATMPKIEVFRMAVHKELITPREELLAVASDKKFSGIPCYELDDAPGLVDLLEKKYLKEG